MRRHNVHAKDIVINKDKVDQMLHDMSMDYITLHEKINDFGLDIGYKGFMTLMSNKSSWKLLYGWTVSNVLNVNIDDIFEIINVDKEKKIRENEAWKNKYKK